MLRDTRVGLIEPMLNSAGTQPLALCTENHRTIDPQCLENPRPKGGISTLAENAPLHFRLSQDTSACVCVVIRRDTVVLGHSVLVPEAGPKVPAIMLVNHASLGFRENPEYGDW
jgi:hypothetical protein